MQQYFYQIYANKYRMILMKTYLFSKGQTVVLPGVGFEECGDGQEDEVYKMRGYKPVKIGS